MWAYLILLWLRSTRVTHDAWIAAEGANVSTPAHANERRPSWGANFGVFKSTYAYGMLNVAPLEYVLVMISYKAYIYKYGNSLAVM